MGSKMKIVLAGAALIALAACTQDKPAPLGPPVVSEVTAPPMDANAVRTLVVGNTGTGPMSGSHVMFTMYISPDGSALADLPTGIEHGAWRLTADGEFCTKWENYRAGQEYCQRVYAKGASYKFADTTSDELLTFTPGKHING